MPSPRPGQPPGSLHAAVQALSATQCKGGSVRDTNHSQVRTTRRWVSSCFVGFFDSENDCCDYNPDVKPRGWRSPWPYLISSKTNRPATFFCYKLYAGEANAKCYKPEDILKRPRLCLLPHKTKIISPYSPFVIKLKDSLSKLLDSIGKNIQLTLRNLVYIKTYKLMQHYKIFIFSSTKTPTFNKYLPHKLNALT